MLFVWNTILRNFRFTPTLLDSSWLILTILYSLMSNKKYTDKIRSNFRWETSGRSSRSMERGLYRLFRRKWRTFRLNHYLPNTTYFGNEFLLNRVSTFIRRYTYVRTHLLAFIHVNVSLRLEKLQFIFAQFSFLLTFLNTSSWY